MRKLLILAFLGAMLVGGCATQSSEIGSPTSVSKPPPVTYTDP